MGELDWVSCDPLKSSVELITIFNLCSENSFFLLMGVPTGPERLFYFRPSQITISFSALHATKYIFQQQWRYPYRTL